MKGEVAPCEHREYGHAEVSIIKESPLFNGFGESMKVWMSHGDQLRKAPDDFEVIARTSTSPMTAIGHKSLPIYGISVVN